MAKIWKNLGKLGRSRKIWENWENRENQEKLGKLGNYGKFRKIGKIVKIWKNCKKLSINRPEKNAFFRFSQKWRKQGPRADLMHNFEKAKISIFPYNRQ